MYYEGSLQQMIGKEQTDKHIVSNIWFILSTCNLNMRFVRHEIGQPTPILLLRSDRKTYSRLTKDWLQRIFFFFSSVGSSYSIFSGQGPWTRNQDQARTDVEKDRFRERETIGFFKGFFRKEISPVSSKYRQNLFSQRKSFENI